MLACWIKPGTLRPRETLRRWISTFFVDRRTMIVGSHAHKGWFTTMIRPMIILVTEEPAGQGCLGFYMSSFARPRAFASGYSHQFVV